MLSRLDVRKFFISLLLAFICGTSFAQIPNFYRPAGKDNLYTYADISYDGYTGLGHSLTTFQYGFTEHFASGLKFTESLIYFVQRVGFKINDHVGIGGEISPVFDLHNDFKFRGFSGCIGANGQIAGNWFYCANIWYRIEKSNTAASLYGFGGYDLALNEKWTFSPMLGIGTRLDIGNAVTPIIGLYFQHGAVGYLLYFSEFGPNTCVELCVDFRIPVRRDRL